MNLNLHHDSWLLVNIENETVFEAACFFPKGNNTTSPCEISVPHTVYESAVTIKKAAQNTGSSLRKEKKVRKYTTVLALKSTTKATKSLSILSY